MNDKPNLYTIIYWLIQDKKISPDSLFDFIELYWPTFLEKDNYVFLRESFRDEEYTRLTNQKTDPELWMNFLLIDPYFEEDNDGDEKAERLSRILVEIWQTKLKMDFPDKKFIVEYLHDSEIGDYGLTFYQTNIKNDSNAIEESMRISTPNIKENKVEQSSFGPRPGIPQVRKPRPDELPKG